MLNSYDEFFVNPSWEVYSHRSQILPEEPIGILQFRVPFYLFLHGRKKAKKKLYIKIAAFIPQTRNSLPNAKQNTKLKRDECCVNMQKPH